MPFQVTLLTRSVVTNFTFQWLISFNEPMQHVYFTLFRTRVVKYLTFEWLIYFMNRWNMLFQITLLRKSGVTNFTFEWPADFL